MIKLVKVETILGEAVLTFGVSVEGTTQTIIIYENEIFKRLAQVKQLLGTELTLQDMKNVVVTLINELRKGKKSLIERFNYTQYIGVDLEA